MKFNHQRIKEIRVFNRLKQKEVAEALNVTPQNYNRYEKGTRQVTIDFLLAFSEYFKVNFNWFFNYNQEIDLLKSNHYQYSLLDYAILYDEAFQKTYESYRLYRIATLAHSKECKRLNVPFIMTDEINRLKKDWEPFYNQTKNFEELIKEIMIEKEKSIFK